MHWQPSKQVESVEQAEGSCMELSSPPSPVPERGLDLICTIYNSLASIHPLA